MRLTRILSAPLRVALAPKTVLDKEREEARTANHGLSEGMVVAVAAAALFALIEDMVSGAMQFSFYSTLASEDFATYHRFTPWMHIVGAAAFMFAVYMKKVTYWLVYAIPCLLIIHDLVLLGLIHGVIQPSDLEVFDFGPAWWKSA